MARDDYYVLIYQILSYLYQCLKKGETPKEENLKPNSYLFKVEINEKYWEYILKNLYAEEFIKGIKLYRGDNKIEIVGLERMEITPKGIAFLTENSTINKAKEFLKETKEIIPFI